MIDSTRVVDDYLKRLERALGGLPAEGRNEIVAEIREHIEMSAGQSIDRLSEAEARTILDQLGDPETIAADARERFGVQERKGGPLEGFAIVLLLVGGFIGPGLGWIAGVVMLWVSKVWTTRDKIIGTVFVPGGLTLTFFLGAFAVGASSQVVCKSGPRATEICSSSSSAGTDVWGYFLIAFLVIAPIASAIYLGRRAFGKRAA